MINLATDLDDKAIKLRIGNHYYDVSVTDKYLRQTRTGVVHRIENALRRLAGRDGFEPRMTKLFRSLIRPQDQILDIGANIGCTSLLFSDLGKQVHAFEPVPETFRLLVKNINRNAKTNISAHNHALGREAKVSLVAYADENRSGAFVADKTMLDNISSSSIEIKRLDDIWAGLAMPRLDFIKMDVEGYEMNVIDGAWKVIERFNPVIELEMNSWCLNVMQRISLPDFLDFIVQRFPCAYAIEGANYIDLQNPAGRWIVMQENVLNQRFREVVLALKEDRVAEFKKTYSLRTQ